MAKVVNEVLIFFKGFLRRVTVIVGIAGLWKLPVVQNVVHSPTLVAVGRWGVPVMMVGVIMAGMTVPKSELELAKLAVMRQPDSPSGHLRLAEAAGKLYDYTLAETEYQKANPPTGEAGQQVLGVREAVYPEEAIKDARENIARELVRLPNYRDGLLRAAVLAWKVYDEASAKNLWEEAKTLDPNNPTVQEIGKLLLF